MENKVKNLTDTEITNLITCWKIKLRDGSIFGFCEADNNIIIDEVEYHACVGFNRSAVESNTTLSVDNLSIDGIIDHHLIKHEDLISGKFDYAEISFFMIDSIKLEHSEKINLRTGWFGEITVHEGNFIVEIKGLLQAYTQTIGDLYSPQCRAQLGDAKCKFEINSLAYTGSIKKILAEDEFIDFNINQECGYYKYGKIKFLSGSNQGLEFEVLDHIGTQIILCDFPPHPLKRMDKYVIQPGCDRERDTCISKFSNIVNFRGEPFIPQVNKFLF